MRLNTTITQLLEVTRDMYIQPKLYRPQKNKLDLIIYCVLTSTYNLTFFNRLFIVKKVLSFNVKMILIRFGNGFEIDDENAIPHVHTQQNVKAAMCNNHERRIFITNETKSKCVCEIKCNART